MSEAILVYGEALADLVPVDACASRYDAVLGGSGFNTALALARYGANVALCASLSDDALGRRFSQKLDDEAIDRRMVATIDAPTPLAIVEPMKADGVASYRFHLAGTACQVPPPLPKQLSGFAHLHVTSFAALVGASGEAALALMRLARAEGLSVSFDPNIRPAALPPLLEARQAIEQRIALCHLVKASVEDISWLYDDGDAALDRWLDLGAGARLVTNGEHGARLEWSGGAAMFGLPRSVVVVDTIGAGDAFMAGFLGSLSDSGHLGPQRMSDPDFQIAEHALDAGHEFAAATCAVRGCDPPDRRDSRAATP